MSARKERHETGLLLFLFLGSGAAALVYEVLWLKELGRLFGVTAQAAATTLGVFFLGLSAGAWFWGTRSARATNALRTYGYLEIAIAATALLYFLILDLYELLYPTLFGALVGRPGLLLLAKFALALGVLFPPAFFMGGTLPVMGGYMIRRADQLGLRASLLYGVNTTGAAIGALSAGFFMPPLLGFRASYLVAIGLNLTIGTVALRWSRGGTGRRAGVGSPTPSTRDDEKKSVVARPGFVRTVAVLSGFATLGLEVLWVRMYAQVLQNSVYTFAAILTVFLLSLALGSVLANLLCRASAPPYTVLFWLLTVAGLLVGLTPLLFYGVTEGLEPVGGQSGWAGYITSVFGHTSLVLLAPGIAIGSVFPFLMKLAESWSRGAGKTIGQLASSNTAAAIVGSLTAGFVLLEGLGLWNSFRLLAILYLALAPFAFPGGISHRPLLRGLPVAGALFFAMAPVYSGFAVVHVGPGEELAQSWEGSLGTVAVVRRGGVVRMKFNNYYTLGGSDSAILHRRQSTLPLSLHASPRSVFFLGMGTGISAGAALDHPVERVVISELSPEIVEAARIHFEPYLNGLFRDPRVKIVREDGRNYLQGTRETYDVIIGDLFLTWKSGSGSLYTREHFETVRKRLAPAGLFAQWLPLAQLSRREFDVIARTMLEVFPQVTLWRRGFSMGTPAVALVGRNENTPLDNESFGTGIAAAMGRAADGSWISRIPHALYAGNLSAVKSLFAGEELNTDDRPLIEYRAPISNRDMIARRSATLTGLELARLYGTLLRQLPPPRDPYLVELSEQEKDHVVAGLALYNHLVAKHSKQTAEAARHLRHFERLSGLRLGSSAR